jgi:phosphatidylglycerophosphate synthase
VISSGSEVWEDHLAQLANATAGCYQLTHILGIEMKFENLSVLRNVVVGLLVIYLIVEVISTGSDFLEVGMLNKMRAGTFTSEAEMMSAAEASDQRQQFLGIAALLAFLVSGITSLVWMYRATRNAAGLSAMAPKFTPGWSVGWYFIPIAALWKPFQAMSELWRRSAFPTTIEGPSALGFWWALWIVTNVLSQGYLRAVSNASTMDQYVLASWLGFWSDLLEVPLILIFMWLIARITAMQIAKHADAPDRPRDALFAEPGGPAVA